MSAPENKNGLVLPEYNGNYSDNLRWNDQKLAEWARTVNLRTNIHIKEGNANPEKTYEGLGDVLVWKQIANPLSLVLKPLDPQGFIDTDQTAFAQESTLYLNHRRITEHVLKRSSGKMDEELFVSIINSSVKTGLLGISASLSLQRVEQTFFKWIHVGIETSGLVVTFAPLYWVDLIAAQGRVSNYMTAITQDPTIYFPIRCLEVMGFLGFSALAMEPILQAMTKIVNFYNRYRYNTQSLNDSYNALKPIKDYASGLVYLNTRGKQLVTYDPIKG